MVKLKPMSQSEFENYYPAEIRSYAAECARVWDLDMEEATAMAIQSYDTLFPDRQVATPDHHVRWIEADGVRVGVIHFSVRRERKKPYLYIWNLSVDLAQRGRGHAEAALRALEEEAKALGVDSIGLNVFGHNAVARRLYDRVGYRATAINMIKDLKLAPVRVGEGQDFVRISAT